VEALERARFSQPDLILLDVKSPGGIDGFRNLPSAQDERADARYFGDLMTSLTGIEDLIEVSRGRADYVTKPVQIDE